MTDVRANFAALAEATFRHYKRTPQVRTPTWWRLLSDPALVALQDSGISLNPMELPIPEWRPLTDSLLSFYPFNQFAAGGDVEPMLRSAADGSRLPPRGIFRALLEPAFAKLHAEQIVPDITSFVEQALYNFEDLCAVLDGKPCEALVVCGVVGLRYPPGTAVSTPWGTLRSLPEPDPASMFYYQHGDPATCTLTDRRRISMKIDRSREADETFNNKEISVESARVLLPVACALASDPVDDGRGAALTWTCVIPSISFGFGTSAPLTPTKMWGPPLQADPVQLEHWADTVGTHHRPSIDVAARRLTSALAYRQDRADALIDAVMVWENLVGSDAEVSFRVTAALAKVLEPEPSLRSALRKRLSNIYGLRSRIVHGSHVTPGDIDNSVTEAISVAVRTLRAFYNRGAAWLDMKSHEHNATILMVDP